MADLRCHAGGAGRRAGLRQRGEGLPVLVPGRRQPVPALRAREGSPNRGPGSLAGSHGDAVDPPGATNCPVGGRTGGPHRAPAGPGNGAGLRSHRGGHGLCGRAEGSTPVDSWPAAGQRGGARLGVRGAGGLPGPASFGVRRRGDEYGGQLQPRTGRGGHWQRWLDRSGAVPGHAEQLGAGARAADRLHFHRCG